MNLSELKNGEIGIIVKIGGEGAYRKRLTEMGFIKGQKVEVIKNAPLKDPIEYRIMGYEVSLRRKESALIEVVAQENYTKNIESNDSLGAEKRTSTNNSNPSGNQITVALVGNPNCGKTTIFNNASGGHEHVGNYSGVTIDLKVGFVSYKGYEIKLVDLPGTYSLSAYSPEEIYVRDHIIDSKPEVIINVVAASNLERNLYLTTQLIDLNQRVVLSLNMYDELQKSGDSLDFKQLGELLGMPIVPTIGSKNFGINAIFDKVIEVYEDKCLETRELSINYGDPLSPNINKIEHYISSKKLNFKNLPVRFLALKTLENDTDFLNKYIDHYTSNQEFITLKDKCSAEISAIAKDDCETLISDSKYGFIAGAIKETFKENPIERRRKTEFIDDFITHKFWGFPIFFLFIWVMFKTTFSLGAIPMNLIALGVESISSFIGSALSVGPLRDLLVDGIIAGVGGVIVFLPNILILFFFISFMEDTGYMARVAFIMDKLMHKIGLHGKSFIPLIMGFGCNVPAILSTRTIEDRNNRLLTMLINPFMSCSARLPVYILFLGAFFPAHAGTILFAIYVLGILVAIGVAKLFKRFIFTQKDTPFVMELPPYRMPTLRSTTLHMWNKGEQYLKKMGGIILLASILIWALGYYPLDKGYSKKAANFAQEQNSTFSQTKITNSTDSLKLFEQKEKLIASYKRDLLSERQRNSYLGKIGQAMEPVMQPLGFDWKMGISLISGIAAKEIVVSTLAVLYQADETDGNENGSLMTVLKNDRSGKNGSPISPLSAISFLLFTLLYFPCVAVIAAINKESGSWKWALFTVLYTTIIAWGISFAVYQVGSLIV